MGVLGGVGAGAGRHQVPWTRDQMDGQNAVVAVTKTRVLPIVAHLEDRRRLL